MPTTPKSFIDVGNKPFFAALGSQLQQLMIKSEETTSVKVGRFTSLSSGLREGKSKIEHDMIYKSLEHLPVIASSLVFEPFHAFG